jgi:hypothetical protein
MYGWIGLLLLVVSEFCLFRKIEPVYSWFYCFAWWSYILMADNLLLRVRGSSLLTSRKRELASMLPLSVFAWLLFEGYNLFIRNWGYSGVPSSAWIRWPGYAFAFATVFPGIFITSDLIDWFLFGPAQTSNASEAEPLLRAPVTLPSPFLIAAGAILAVGPLLWPRQFFPAVWVGPIFLLDPLLERLGMQSLSASLSAGVRRQVWSLLLGGLACGLMWEFWNFWAGSKWIYRVPYFGGFKLFEMPVLGFLGFAPFAIECWLFYHVAAAIRRRLNSARAQVSFWAGIAAVSILLFHAIDRHTVLHFASDFPGGYAP